MNLLQKWKQTTIANKLMVYTTAIVAIGTLVSSGMAIFQWQLMKESGKQTSAQVDKLVAETGRIANVSAENARQSKEALNATLEMSRSEQRAWVSVMGASPPIIKDSHAVYLTEGTPVTFGVIITNSGKTPAKNVKHMFGLKMINAGGQFVTTYSSDAEKYMKNVNEHGNVIQQGGNLVLYPPAIGTATKEVIDAIRSGKKIIYVHGLITYSDVFDKPHKNHFLLTNRSQPSVSGKLWDLQLCGLKKEELNEKLRMLSVIFILNEVVIRVVGGR